MVRVWMISGLLLVACTPPKGPNVTPMTYDGYGLPASQVFSGHDFRASDAGHTRLVPNLTVDDIGPALETFLSPEGDRLILLPGRLDRERLDYSLASLSAIDEWLADIHTINELQAGQGKAGEALLSDGRGDNSVIFAGLYLGEVVRRNSDLDWRWRPFDEFMAANPVFAEHYGDEPGLDVFLLVGPQGAASPINTALKRVLAGEEESLAFVASLLVEAVDLEKALSGHDFQGLLETD